MTLHNTISLLLREIQLPVFRKDAPASLGKWIGWQIVRKYMEKILTVTLEKLMNESDAQKILNDSKYKPWKGLILGNL